MGIEIAAQMTCQKLRLQIWHEAERSDLVQERVAALLLLALLPGGKHRLAAGVRKQDSAAVARLEVGATQLPPVDQ
jgi:hypothetical protein